MSVFYCHWCDRYIDSDFDNSEEKDGEMICEGCYTESLEDEEEEKTDE